jgi:hypothetical protein
MALAVVCLAFAVRPCGAGNLIEDPSFEQITVQGDASAWWGPLGGEITDNPVPVAPIHGKFVCHISDPAGGSVGQKVVVEPGKDYIALAWIKVAVFLEAGNFTVRYGEGKESSVQVTNDFWHLYGIPFTAESDTAEITWAMGVNTGGSWCDMFCLAEFENLIVDPSMEEGFPDFDANNGWKWGAEITEDMPRTGSFAWTADPAGGGGFGIYPAFSENDLILAGAWCMTGDNSIFPERDHNGWTNLGWWAVRTSRHVSEINIEVFDLEYNQFIIPYKVPANGTSPEVLWWQDSGESASYCDDLFLMYSPYTDEQIPWEMMLSTWPDWGFWANPDDATWPVTPGTTRNFITGGGLEDPSDWTVYDMGSNEPSVAEFNYTDDRPAAGSGGCLHLFGSSSYTNILVYQEVTLTGGVTYELSGAFKELSGDATGGNWVQLYLSTEPPIAGTDWKPPGGANSDRFLGFNSWVDPSWSDLDGTFESDGLDKDDGQKTNLVTVLGDPGVDVVAYFGVKAGVWGNAPLSFDVLVDDLSLAPVSTGVEEKPALAARTCRLLQNYPNPFNPSTSIRFSMERAGKAKVSVISVSGRCVATLLDRPLSAGDHEVTWNGCGDNGKRLSSGIYFYTLETANTVTTRKMTLLQ